MSILRNYDIFSIEERVHNLEMGGSPTPGGGSWDYSTTETDTHQKWIDGKEIYCKVIEGTFNFVANTALNVGSSSGIDKIVDFRIFASSSGAVASPQVYIDGDNIKGVHFATFGASSVFIAYTKTELTKSTKRSKK